MDFGMGKNNAFRLAGSALLASFFALFFAYPLVLIFSKAFASGFSGFFLLADFLSSHSALLRNSFFQASISTFFAVLIGVPAAYIVARRDFPGKKLLKAFSLVPAVFPSILVVLAFIIVLGNNGWVNSFLSKYLGFNEPVQFLYGFFGIIVAHVFYNFPLVLKFVSSAWENLDVSMKEAAKTLGAGKLRVFLSVTLPQLLPSILASASLVFIYTFMSFAIVISLGGIQFTTLEVEIYRQISRGLNFELGALLALFQFVALSLVAFAYSKFSSRTVIQERLYTEKPQKLNQNSLRGIVELFFLFLVVLFVAVPILSIFVFSFFDAATGAFSLDGIKTIFFPSVKSLSGTTPISAIFNSLAFAIIASVTATFLGLLASLKQTRIKGLNFFLGASIAVSVITLAFGYLVAFGSGNFFIIALGHSVLAFPFALRIIGNALAKVDDASVDAAKTLGANDFSVLKLVQLPRIKGAILASIAFGFAVSLGELGLVLVLYDGVFPTMPVYIFRLLGTYQIFAATTMGLVLAFISFISFYAIETFLKDVRVF